MQYLNIKFQILKNQKIKLKDLIFQLNKCLNMKDLNLQKKMKFILMKLFHKNKNHHGDQNINLKDLNISIELRWVLIGICTIKLIMMLIIHLQKLFKVINLMFFILNSLIKLKYFFNFYFQAPKYTLETCENPDYCIIRFIAGLPYEDLAFQILCREWDYSDRMGFKSVFSRGILHLWFNFKKPRYRR